MRWLVLLLFITSKAYSQSAGMVSQPISNYLSVNYMKGNIMRISESIDPVILKPNQSISLEFEKKLTSPSWSPAFGFPKAGVTFNYTNYNKPGIVGNSYQLLGSLDFRFLRYKQDDFLALNLSTAAGLGYYSRIFNKTTNPLNILVGSRINFNFEARLYLSSNISSYIIRDTELHLGTFINHSSNGAITLPNMGINNYGLFLGLTKGISNGYPWMSSENHKDSLATWKPYIILGSAPKMIERGGSRYWAYSVSGGTSFKISEVFRLLGSLDYFHDTSLRKQQKINGHDKVDINRLALAGGWEILFGHLSLTAQVGYYVYNPYDLVNRNAYQRYGLKYYFNHLFINGSLKAHVGTADFLEIGLGYQL